MKEWFKARNVWAGAFAALTDAEAGRLAKALWAYTTTGEQVELSGNEKGCFAMIVYTLQMDENEANALSATRKEAGCKGGKQKVANIANAKLATNNMANVANAIIKNKNKEKEKEDDEDISTATNSMCAGAYARFIGRIPYPGEELAITSTAKRNGQTDELVELAIQFAAEHGASSPGLYAEKLLRDWSSQRIRTLDDYYNREDA